MSFVMTDDGCEIYYETHGDGAAIAFLPGFMGITDIWRAQIAALSPRYRCIAFDNRGAGRSDKPIPRIAYGVEQHARDFATVLDNLGVERVVLVGHSMGGNTALAFSSAHPERVAGVVFVGSYVSGAQIHNVGNTLARITEAVTLKANRIQFYVDVGCPQEIAIESSKWPLYAVLGNAASFMAFDGVDDLEKLNVPSLIIHGSDDIVSPYDPCATGLAALLDDVDIHRLDGVNHCPMMERPAETTTLLEDFIEQRVSW